MSENFLRGWAKAAGIGLRRDRFRAKCISRPHFFDAGRGRSGAAAKFCTIPCIFMK